MKPKKEVTIYDIARELNISAATVSRGLKDNPNIKKETRKRIAEAARKMGYQQNIFASNLRMQHSNTIGVIVPRLDSYFMSKVIAGIEEVINQAGYNLIISQSSENLKKEIANLTTMLNSRIDGLLISVSGETTDSDHFSFFQQKGVPVVFFDRVVALPGATCVVIDNVKAAYDATAHLLGQGCRRIVHLGGSYLNNVYKDRIVGYQKALAAYQVAFDPELLFKIQLSSETGLLAAQQILQLPALPDGVFAANDSSAIGCIAELKRNGLRIPEDIAVVGFNDDPICRFMKPDLSSISYPSQQIGEVAAQTLIDTIHHQSNTLVNTIILQHELSVRQSSLGQSSLRQSSLGQSSSPGDPVRQSPQKNLWLAPTTNNKQPKQKK